MHQSIHFPWYLIKSSRFWQLITIILNWSTDACVQSLTMTSHQLNPGRMFLCNNISPGSRNSLHGYHINLLSTHFATQHSMDTCLTCQREINLSVGTHPIQLSMYIDSMMTCSQMRYILIPLLLIVDTLKPRYILGGRAILLMFSPGPNTSHSWVPYKTWYRNGELLTVSWATTHRNTTVTAYLHIFACYGLVIGGVNHTINIRTCSSNNIRHLSAQWTDLWTELDHRQKSGSFACVMWLIFSIGSLTHLSIFDNHILWQLVKWWTLAPSLLSLGWNQSITNGMTPPFRLIHRSHWDTLWDSLNMLATSWLLRSGIRTPTKF